MPDLPIATCLRCGYVWPRLVAKPKECQGCGSRNWFLPPRKTIKRACLRCGRAWLSRVACPKQCPTCHSPYWSRRRKPKPAEDVPE